MASANVTEGPCISTAPECQISTINYYGNNLGEAGFDANMDGGQYCFVKSFYVYRGMGGGLSIGDHWAIGSPALPRPSDEEYHAAKIARWPVFSYAPSYTGLSVYMWVRETPISFYGEGHYGCKPNAVVGDSDLFWAQDVTMYINCFDTTCVWFSSLYEAVSLTRLYYKRSTDGSTIVPDLYGPKLPPNVDCVPYYSEYVDLELELDVGYLYYGASFNMYITGNNGIPDQTIPMHIESYQDYPFEFRLYFDDPDTWRDAIISVSIPFLNYNKDFQLYICSECSNSYCIDIESESKYIVGGESVMYPNSIWTYKAELKFDDWEKCRVDMKRTMAISYAGSTITNGVDFIGQTEIVFESGETIKYFEIEIMNAVFEYDQKIIINSASSIMKQCDGSSSEYTVLRKQPTTTCCDFVPKDFVNWADYHNYDEFYGLDPFVVNQEKG